MGWGDDGPPRGGGSTPANGRAFGVSPTPKGIATRGEIGPFGEKWYDNDGNPVASPAGGPMEKFATPGQRWGDGQQGQLGPDEDEDDENMADWAIGQTIWGRILKMFGR